LAIRKLRQAGDTAAFAGLEEVARDYVAEHLSRDDPYL
jgi:hypothetical protein